MHFLAAYIDPGAGSLMWQALAAAFLGSMFYVRRFVTKLRGRGKSDS
jgi:hypothetical protein